MKCKNCGCDVKKDVKEEAVWVHDSGFIYCRNHLSRSIIDHNGPKADPEDKLSVVKNLINRLTDETDLH